MPNHDMLVRDGMTPMPHTIGADQTIEEAAARFHALGVRHLPVQGDDGSVVGLLLQQDVDLVYLTGGRDPSLSTVEDVMALEPYTAPATAPLRIVLRDMAESHACACIVLDGERPVGIVTTTDALRMLSDLLADHRDLVSPATPDSSVRHRLVSEHAALRLACDEIEELANGLIDGDREDDGRLEDQSRELKRMLLRYIELEEQVLSPVLDSSHVIGMGWLRSHERRARRRRAQAERLVARVPARQMAYRARRLVADLRADMAWEERTLLSQTASA